jgi:hypothetical protein
MGLVDRLIIDLLGSRCGLGPWGWRTGGIERR